MAPGLTFQLSLAGRFPHVFATNPGRGFGLGFEILEDPGRAGVYGTAGSYGWGGAYHSAYRVDPAEGLVMVVLTQTLPAGGLDMTNKFYTMVYQAMTN